MGFLGDVMNYDISDMTGMISFVSIVMSYLTLKILYE